MKSIFPIIVLQLIFYTLHAQPKDSTYHAKISAPGTKMIPVFSGKYKVFTQKIGTGNTYLLLLHGGPQNTHEYFENFPEHITVPGVSIYFYDQLGSYFSDTPDDAAIWDINRFIEEVEEVRKGLGIDSFYLLGHSWGGMLAELYAARYGQHLKGLILSNVPGFLTEDGQYLDDILDSLDQVVSYQATLLPKFESNRTQIDSIYRKLSLADTTFHKMLAKQYIKSCDSLYGRTLFYHKAGQWPDAMKRNVRHARFESMEKYNFNPSGADYTSALQQIRTPTLLIAGRNDFLEPERYEDLKKIMTYAKVRVHICPTGAHFTMWDDIEDYFGALNRFIEEVNAGSFDSDK